LQRLVLAVQLQRLVPAVQLQRLVPAVQLQRLVPAVQLQRLVLVLAVQSQRRAPPRPRGPLPLPQAQTCQLPLRALRQPQQPPQERLAALLPPWEREPVRQQVLAQQRARARARARAQALGREQQGLQARRPQASQRSHHRIRVPQSLASSCRHASIAPIRPSKPNR
jgi:hypothetical protein